jgi:hypothetical protein
MDELRVPKRRVPVEVILPGGAARRVVLFLAEAAADHAGGEQPSDLLNGPVEFIPAVDEADGAMTFLHRGAVAVVRVAPELEPDEAEEFTLPTEHEVEVHLAGGGVRAGLVSFLRPDRTRLVDFLNEPSPFFRLLEADAVALVNKRHVTRVVLLAR